jgi:hypothetical protein
MKRIQRKRTKGWRMPPNTVYVGRPTKWGNPFKIIDLEIYEQDHPEDKERVRISRKWAVNRFRNWIKGGEEYVPDPVASEKRRQAILSSLHELKGKDLACWCPLDQPCHADALIELLMEQVNNETNQS